MAFISLDFETFYSSKANKKLGVGAYSLKTLTYEQYIRDPRFLVQGVGIKIDNAPTYYVYENIKAHLQTIFTPDNAHTMLAHNNMFDAAILNWYFKLSAQRYLCTMDMARAIWPTLPASLDEVTKRLFPDDQTKWKGKELQTVDGHRVLDEAQQKVLGGYCIQDVDIMFECFKVMYPFFPKKELDVIDLTLKMFVEPHIRADRDRLQRYLPELQAKKEALIKASGVPKPTLASGPKFALYIRDTLGIPFEQVSSPTKKNPDNIKWPLAKDSPEFLSLQSDYPQHRAIWEARIAATSTIEESRTIRLLDHSAPSHINENSVIALPLRYYGAHTGRWSGTNKINAQNFSRGGEIRKSLIAPPGHKVGVADLSNIEGRVLAWFAGQEDKLISFRNNEDIYNQLATAIYGYPVNRKDPAQQTEGFVGKVAELGLGYQMGWKTLRATFAKGVMGGDPLYLSESEARRIVNIYRQKNYKIQALWKEAERIIAAMATKKTTPFMWNCLEVQPGRLRLPNGLFLVFPGLHYSEASENPNDHGFLYWNGKFWKSLYGGLLVENIIQALSRIIMAEMMLEVHSMLLPYKGRVSLTVHDEIVFIAPEEHIETTLDKTIKIMSTTPDWCSKGGLVLSAEGGYDDNYSK